MAYQEIPAAGAESDENIASQVQAGSSDAFGILINRYEQKMRRYAAKFISDRDDIQDVVQEVFVKAYANINSFDVSRKFSPWLYRIAHNELVNTLRRRQKKSFLPLFDLDTFLPGNADKKNQITSQLEAKEIRHIVTTHLEQLPDKYKEPIVLHYLEDLSYQEISDIMRLPVSTVGTRIIRAKRMMAEMMKTNPMH